MIEVNALLNVDQAATAFGVHYTIILRKIMEKEIAAEQIVRHDSETKIHLNELIIVFGTPRIKPSKKNQGIRLDKPRSHTKKKSATDVAYVESMEADIVMLREQLTYERHQAHQEREKLKQYLHEMQEHAHQQQVRIERYEQGIAELWKMIRAIKTEH